MYRTTSSRDAFQQSLPQLPRTTIVWRCQFLLGALYYALVNPERVSRLSRGESDGSDTAEGIEQLVSATVASLQAPDPNDLRGEATMGGRRAPGRARWAKAKPD